MKHLSKTIGPLIAVGLTGGAVQALAYEAGDIVVRAGYAHVAPNDDSDDIVLLGSALPGTHVNVDDGAALGITAGFMFSPSWGLELLAATPFEHDIEADLSSVALGSVDAGSAKHLPPTLSLVWYPMTGNNSAFQPYLGAGINYTTFFSEDVDRQLENVVGASLDLELEDSWGPAAQIGFDYALNEKWHVNGSIRWIGIDTEAKIKAGGTVITVDDVQIDPIVYQLNLGYTF